MLTKILNTEKFYRIHSFFANLNNSSINLVRTIKMVKNILLLISGEVNILLTCNVTPIKHETTYPVALNY